MPLNPVPKDRQAREHVAAVEEIRWADPQTGFLIARLRDGHTVTGRADADGLIVGATIYRFLGRWKDHARHGAQFAFDTYTVQTPAGRNGVVRYLTQLCDGIGERRAAKLFEAYGSDAVQVLRTDAARVIADGVLTEAVATEAAKQLAESIALEGTRIALFDLFAGRGFPADVLIKESIGEWGARAPDVIRRNPYTLMVKEMAGCGFKRCDKLYLELNLPPARLKRQMLAGWNALRTDGSGHTWFPVEQAVRCVREAIGDGAKPERAIRMGIRARWLRHRRDAARKLWVAEAEKAVNEQAIANCVVRLVRRGRGRINWPVVGELTGPDPDHQPSDHQREKLHAATREAVGILAGTPGTGKTFTAAAMLRAIVELHGIDDVCVCAPTGKAAVRCTQALQAAKVNLLATTIHRRLGLGKASKAKGELPQFDEYNPLPFGFVIVDEVSMCDADILAHLLRACADGTHVLLIGDPYQLPPVGHGAPLRDLMTAGVPCGELTEIRRNAGLIVRACAAIKDGKPFETAERYDPDAGANLRVIDRPDEQKTLEALQGILERFQSAGTFHPVWQTQIIVGVNDKGELSRKALNDRLQTMLNPDGRQQQEHPFRVGDKLICLKNGRLKPVELARGYEERSDEVASWQPARGEYGENLDDRYVANGEIGRVLAIGPGVTIARFSENEAVRIPMGKVKDDGDSPSEAEKGRGCNFDLGYAVTCHKMQGSESPCVIVVVDEAAGRVASREWVYTAVSRASRLCVAVGPRAVLEKQAKRVSLKRRKTFLVELVTEQMAGCETTVQ